MLRTRMQIVGQNQLSDAEFIEMRISVTSKYRRSRVLLVTYAAILAISNFSPLRGLALL